MQYNVAHFNGQTDKRTARPRHAKMGRLKMRDWKMENKKCRGGKCETGKLSTKMLLIAMRSSTLSEKVTHWTPYFFPDTVYKRYANNEPNSNHTSLVG